MNIARNKNAKKQINVNRFSVFSVFRVQHSVLSDQSQGHETCV